MEFGLDTRKIFIGGKKGASKARPKPKSNPKSSTKKASTKKGSTKKGSTKKGSTKKGGPKKGSTKKGSTKKGGPKKGSTKKGSTKKGSTKKGKGKGKGKGKPKGKGKKKPKTKKKKDKGKGSASFLGGPGGLAGALAAGLQTAMAAAAELAKNAAEAAAAFLDTVKGMFSGLGNSSGASGNSGSINGASAANTSAEGLDGNCNAAQLKAKQDADARRNSKLEKYGTLSPSAGLTLLTQVDKAYDEELTKAGISGGTCKSEKPENSEAPEKSSDTVKPTVYSIAPSVPDVKFLDALNESLKVLNISEPDSIKDLVKEKDNVENLIKTTKDLDKRTKIVAAAMVAFDPVNSKRYFELTKGDNSDYKEEANT